MQRNSGTLLVLFLSLGFSASAQKAPDAVAADPQVHQVLLENEHVRVFSARASRGATSPMHSHPPFVFIGLDQARLRLTQTDGKHVLNDVHPGLAVWVGATVNHSWKLLSGNVGVIGVEVKSAQKAAPPVPVMRGADDSVIVDPDVHKVLFENEHVRVYDGRATAGTRSPMHSHPPSLIVMLGQGRGRLTLPDGNKAILDYTPGQVMWAGEGMRHSWEMLSGDPHVIVIEPKSAHIPPARKD